MCVLQSLVDDVKTPRIVQQTLPSLPTKQPTASPSNQNSLCVPTMEPRSIFLWKIKEKQSTAGSPGGNATATTKPMERSNALAECFKYKYQRHRAVRARPSHAASSVATISLLVSPFWLSTSASTFSISIGLVPPKVSRAHTFLPIAFQHAPGHRRHDDGDTMAGLHVWLLQLHGGGHTHPQEGGRLDEVRILKDAVDVRGLGHSAHCETTIGHEACLRQLGAN